MERGAAPRRAAPGGATPRAGEVSVELLPIENSALVLSLPGISTATVYEGDPAVCEEHLRKRVGEVLRLNPWLLGRLERSARTGRVHLVHRVYRNGAAVTEEAEVEAEAEADAAAAAAAVFSVADAPGLGAASQPYEETARALLHLRVAKGVDCLAAAARGAPPSLLPPLLRVTLLRTAPRAFVVFFSFSHVAGDGATFYELHSMLGDGAAADGAAPRALRFERAGAEEYEAAADKLMGGARGAVNEAIAWILSAGSILRILAHMALGARPRAEQQRVPPAWVAERKRAAAAEVAAAAGAPAQSSAFAAEGPRAPAPAPAFVSTNDIVVSALARVSGDDLIFMAANLRGRVAGIDRDLAGNFETMVPLLAEDVATPALVRRAVAPGRLHRASLEHGARLPSPLAALFTRACVITNWSSFYRDVAIPGATLVRHLPIAETHSANMESVVVFAPRAGEVEVIWLTRNPRVTPKALAAAFSA
jgi:hypothetical protein